MSGGNGTTILSCANHLKGATRDTPNGNMACKKRVIDLEGLDT